MQMALGVCGFVGCTAVSVAAPVWAEMAPTQADLRAHVDVLTAPEMEGRLTGSPGARRAAAYISEQLEEIGLQPLDGAYLHPFAFPAGIEFGPDNHLRLADVEAVFGTEWRPLSFSASGKVEAAPVVFAGYGLVAVGSDGYDSYADADISGKWVFVYRGVPQDAPVETRVTLARVSALRYKASVAKARGAKGIIVAPAPGVDYADELPSVPFDATFGQAELPAIAVNRQTADQMLNRLGPEREAMETRLRAGETFAPLNIPGLSLRAEIDVTTERKEAVNVVGVISSGAAQDVPPLIIGGHFDHLGQGEAQNSLARDAEKGQIHPGADDNASGVATLIEIARAVQARRSELSRDVLIAAWSGEELGLLGSHAFAQDRVGAAYLNLDMVGRLEDKLQIAGFASATDWDRIVTRAAQASELDIARIDTPFVPSDATSFYSVDVPVLAFTTGAHTDYHTPRDTAETLNYPGMARITSLVTDIAMILATASEAPEYVAGAVAPVPSGRRRASVTLGTIPQYADADVKGIAIADAVPGGPAAKAGLVGGDVIVGLASAPVADIYDFMRILNGLKPDETVNVTVQRADRNILLQITPAARADQ